MVLYALQPFLGIFQRLQRACSGGRSKLHDQKALRIVRRLFCFLRTSSEEVGRCGRRGLARKIGVEPGSWNLPIIVPAWRQATRLSNSLTGSSGQAHHTHDEIQGYLTLFRGNGTRHRDAPNR